MSAVRELTAALIDGGMDPVDAATLVGRAGAEFAVAAPSKGAVRTRNWRARNASQTVTGDATVTPKINVTERHQTSPNVTSDAASLSLENKQDQETGKKREKARASQLPDGWRPDEHAWQASIALIGTQRCELELVKFRNHAADKGRVSKSWNAAWRNWVDRAIEYGGQNGHGTSANRTAASAGSTQTGADSILAGMGRLAARNAERKLAERSGDREREPGFDLTDESLPHRH